MANDYDVIVVGGGLAGLTAAMFAARYGLQTGLIERTMTGGQIVNAERVDNFPGFPNGISGAELAPAVQEQAESAGADMMLAEVTGIANDGAYKRVSVEEGSIRSKTVIVATGSRRRNLGLPGEEEFYGRGISDCAACDGPLYARQVVGVVGGGDSAVDEAEVLSSFSERVLVFHRRGQLRAHKALRDRLQQNRKVDMVWNSTVQEVLGEDQVSGVRIHNVVTNLESTIDLSGLFIYVGLEPRGSVVQGLLNVDGAGHIPVNVSMETEVPGLYAAGDVRQHSASQLVSSAGDGATAAMAAFRYIGRKEW